MANRESEAGIVSPTQEGYDVINEAMSTSNP